MQDMKDMKFKYPQLISSLSKSTDVRAFYENKNQIKLDD